MERYNLGVWLCVQHTQWYIEPQAEKSHQEEVSQNSRLLELPDEVHHPPAQSHDNSGICESTNSFLKLSIHFTLYHLLQNAGSIKTWSFSKADGG